MKSKTFSVCAQGILKFMCIFLICFFNQKKMQAAVLSNDDTSLSNSLVCHLFYAYAFKGDCANTGGDAAVYNKSAQPQ